MIDGQNLCDSGMCRPGGFAITDRAVQYCAFSSKAKLADIGCGLGATVQHVRDKYGFLAYGVDLVTSAPNCMVGDAHCLPLEDGSMEGLLFECSLSKMRDPETVLSQAFRALAPNGKIVISDFYSLGESSAFPGRIGWVGSQKDLHRTLQRSGFSVLLFEDYTEHMKALWGQMILTYGLDAVCRSYGFCTRTARRPKLGYCLIVARKEEKVS